MRYLQKIINVFRIIKCLGILQTILFIKNKNKKGIRFQIKPKSYKNLFTLRGGTSDAWVFDMNIIREEYFFFKPKNEVKTIIDAGANIGSASRYFARRFPDAEIVAVEPDSNNFEILLSNCHKNPRINCLEGGVWSKDTKLAVINKKGWKYAFRIKEDIENGNIKGFSIPGIMELMGWDFIDLLKMDIEGSETEVMLNGIDDWSHKIGALIIEIHPDLNSKGAGLLFNAFANRDFDLKYRGENLILIFNDV